MFNEIIDDNTANQKQLDLEYLVPFKDMMNYM